MPEHAARELDQLAGHRVLEAVDARDAVADREHGAGLGDVDLAVVLLDLALEDVGDLAGLDVHRTPIVPLARVARSWRSCVRRLPSKTTSPTVRDHAADQRGIDRDLELDVAAGARARARAGAARAARRRAGRAATTRACDEPGRRVGEPLELGADRVEVDQAALVDQRRRRSCARAARARAARTASAAPRGAPSTGCSGRSSASRSAALGFERAPRAARARRAPASIAPVSSASAKSARA